ncbi:MAG: peptidoglycan DD-metalloendopeptidase family protein, partial [Burkholderiaceae bacterium]|nr:peptidoglycan DD-metalloendopeptidase family protein [Burkholderiaceae bacterium]
IVDGVGTSSTPAPAALGSYVVKPGDTLYAIARSTNVDFETIKRLNNLSDPNQLVVGQVLRLSASGTASPAPTGAKPSGSGAPVKPGSAPPASSTEPRPLDAPAQTPTATTTPPPPGSNQPHPVPAADAGTINWAWPTSKRSLIQRFNANTKGIDIEGQPGDSVHASADGKVMYVGNGVRGMGNLVIVNHDNGFISVYGHNSKLLVKTGQTVKRGDKIAEVGATDTTSPRLHFEVRRRGTPVDPLQYLPAP